MRNTQFFLQTKCSVPKVWREKSSATLILNNKGFLTYVIFKLPQHNFDMDIISIKTLCTYTKLRLEEIECLRFQISGACQFQLGTSALMLAIAGNHRKIVQYLLDHDVDLLQEDRVKSNKKFSGCSNLVTISIPWR